jgi:UDP-N-acetylglucosamine 2-epimerase (non-hydrolysing)
LKPIVDLVAGARPNFMKLAPVVRAVSEAGLLTPRIVHTGQHYDPSMNAVFFTELGIPEPDVHLEAGSGSHGLQTARILERYEAHVLASRPAATVVFGDVNSTVACALAAVKLGIPVAHVEAGLRSFDRTMPEEINRLVTDAISDLLLVSEESGIENLRREGVADSKTRLVGNVMIDTLFSQLDLARSRAVAARLGLAPNSYGVVTLHRPSNVDGVENLVRVIDLLDELSAQLPLVFLIHPRTLESAKRAGLGERLAPGRMPLVCVGPQPYVDTLSLVSGARVVLTDSGGLQEETSVLRVPCLTMRENTERPVTVERGTSRLVGSDPAKVRAAFAEVMRGEWTKGETIPFWDGHAGVRVARELAAWLGAGA